MKEPAPGLISEQGPKTFRKESINSAEQDKFLIENECGENNFAAQVKAYDKNLKTRKDAIRTRILTTDPRYDHTNEEELFQEEWGKCLRDPESYESITTKFRDEAREKIAEKDRSKEEEMGQKRTTLNDKKAEYDRLSAAMAQAQIYEDPAQLQARQSYLDNLQEQIERLNELLK